MKVVSTQLGSKPTEVYPYTHRLEFMEESISFYKTVTDWMKNNNIKCVHMPVYLMESRHIGFAVYVNEPDAIKLGLRWMA